MIDDETHHIGDCFSAVLDFLPTMTAYDLEYDVLEYDDTGFNYVLASGNPRKPGEIHITAKFKDMPTCKGVAQMRICTLHQGVVEYAVVLQNSTISLQYPHWQNDTFLYKMDRQHQGYLTQWLEAFSTLNPANRYDITHTGQFSKFNSYQYVNCNAWEDRPASNMSCYSSSDSGFTFRDRDRFGGGSQSIVWPSCEDTWRDPIQVFKLHFPFLFSFEFIAL